VSGSRQAPTEPVACSCRRSGPVEYREADPACAVHGAARQAPTEELQGLALRILSAHEDADWSALAEIASDGHGMDALAALAESWLNQRTALVVAQEYRQIVLERPEDDDAEYLPWLMRLNSAGNAFSSAVAAVVSGTPGGGGIS
jgi:hypothetical protein